MRIRFEFPKGRHVEIEAEQLHTYGNPMGDPSSRLINAMKTTGWIAYKNSRGDDVYVNINKCERILEIN